MIRRTSASRRNALARRPARSSAQTARLRLGLVGGVIGVLFLAMFARLYSLQVLKSTGYTQLAAANSVQPVSVAPPRGNILVRSGQVLAGSAVTEAVTWSDYAAKQHPAVVGRLAKVLHMTKAQVMTALNSKQVTEYVPIPIATNVSKSVIVYIAEHSSEFPGVSAQAISQRTYPYGDTASQLLGFLNPISGSEIKEPQYKGYSAGDLVGQSGVEDSFNSSLYGKPGTTDLLVDSNGQVVGTGTTTSPTAGDSVQLNLDLSLQQTLETALSTAILNVRGTYVQQANTDAAAPAGAAVVMNPETGAVYAMASYPTYKPSEWVGGISTSDFNALNDPNNNEPLLNRAIQGLYTPGSTFKLATSTAALNTGLITPSYYYNDATGSYTAVGCTGQCTFTDDDSSAQGEVNITDAITVSDDVFFYNIGDMFYNAYETNGEYGFTPIQKAANAYSLGKGTGVDLPGEEAGSVDSYANREANCVGAPKSDPNCPATWYAGDNIEVAFGQGQTVVTPLELADAYATFANGGTRYQPQVAADIVDAQGKVVKRFAPVVTGHVKMSAANHNAMLQGFLGVVQSPKGTAYGPFQGFDFSKLDVAGKTGTASTNHPVPNSLFVAFAGADINNPQYVVAVVIEQAGYGSAVSAPVAATTLKYLEAHPVGPIKAPKPSPVLVPELTPPSSTTTSTSTTSTTTSGSGTSTVTGNTGSNSTYTTSTTYQSAPTYSSTTTPTSTPPTSTPPTSTTPTSTTPTSTTPTSTTPTSTTPTSTTPTSTTPSSTPPTSTTPSSTTPTSTTPTSTTPTPTTPTPTGG